MNDKQVIALCKSADGIESEKETTQLTIVLRGKEGKAARRWMQEQMRQDRIEEEQFRAELKRRLATDPEFAAEWNAIDKLEIERVTVEDAAGKQLDDGAWKSFTLNKQGRVAHADSMEIVIED
jgi:hypothetical protein